MAAQPTNNTPAVHTDDARPARPGDRCACGRPALTVFITEHFGEVPYCGKGHDNPVLTEDWEAAPPTDEELRAMPVEDLARLAKRLMRLAEQTVKTANEAVGAAGRAANILDEHAKS